MTERDRNHAHDDPFDLHRFLEAQEGVYARALRELRSGRKRGHWMWFIFPQIEGLGRSATTRYYAVKSAAEARAYLRHPVLGPRLRDCARALLALDTHAARDVLGYPDNLKLRSSMTLFAHAAGESGTVFHRVLDQYFDGEPDRRTLDLLGEPAQ
jgi:uncharacterized protein (DUF1810 family)